MDDLDDVEVARLTTMVSGALITQMVSAAASLGLADAMGLDTVTTGQLAERCGAEERSLGRLLRGLASLGVLEELTPKSFALTDMGHLLRSDHPRSLRSWCIVHGELLAPLWGALLDAVRSGRPAAAEVFGQPFYAHLAAHPTLNDDWNRAMAETARAWWASGDLLDVVDWSTVNRTVIDVGGGQGGLLAGVLQRHPHLRGVVYDLPDAVAGAPAFLAAARVADRAEAVAGDFFESVPAGGDVYLLCRGGLQLGRRAGVAGAGCLPPGDERRCPALCDRPGRSRRGPRPLREDQRREPAHHGGPGSHCSRMGRADRKGATVRGRADHLDDRRCLDGDGASPAIGAVEPGRRVAPMSARSTPDAVAYGWA